MRDLKWLSLNERSDEGLDFKGSGKEDKERERLREMERGRGREKK